MSTPGGARGAARPASRERCTSSLVVKIAFESADPYKTETAAPSSSPQLLDLLAGPSALTPKERMETYPPRHISDLFQQIDHSVLITDVNGCILYVNPAFERASGYTQAEVLGKTPRILKSGVHSEELYRELWATLLAGRPFEYEFTNRKKNGELHEEKVWIMPIRDESGKLARFLALRRAEETSARSYDLFTLLAEGSPAGVYMRRDDRIVFANGQYEALTGFSARQLLGKKWWHLIPAEDRPAARQHSTAMLANERMEPYEYKVVCHDGSIRWLLESVRRVELRGIESSPTVYEAATVVDITQRKAAEESLQESLSVYTATLEATSDAIIVTNLDGRVVHTNQRFRDLWSLGSIVAGSSAQLVRMRSQLLEPDLFTRFVEEVRGTDREAHRRVDLIDGRVLLLSTRPHYLRGIVAGRVWSWLDITEPVYNDLRLRRLANYDSLTGLLNRRRFQERLEESVELELATCGKGALLLMDVDQFKDINDTLGHEEGDAALVHLAGVIQSSAADHLVGRVGGDEFAIYISNTSPTEARMFARQLLASLQKETFMIAGVPSHLTMSIGIAMVPADGITTRDILVHADKAMYDAKFAGRNRVVMYSQASARQTTARRHDWEHRINEAIAERGLSLYAQPVVSLPSRETAGYELLLRMTNPDGSVLAAKDFIPVAEDLGLIRILDEWVIREAASLLHETESNGARFKLGVNLSGRAFADDSMLAHIRQTLGEFKADPKRLIVEVTETAALADIGKARGFVTAIRSLGCLFALDDFGVGYSSFYNLKNLPVDILKVDGTFVKDLNRSPASRLIVRAIVDVARGMDITTVAEFVASEATLRAVSRLGVDSAQGYFVGRPLPVSQVLRPYLNSEAAA